MFPRVGAADDAVVGVEGEERMGPKDRSSLLAMLFDGREECN